MSSSVKGAGIWPLLSGALVSFRRWKETLNSVSAAPVGISASYPLPSADISYVLPSTSTESASPSLRST